MAIHNSTKEKRIAWARERESERETSEKTWEESFSWEKFFVLLLMPLKLNSKFKYTEEENAVQQNILCIRHFFFDSVGLSFHHSLEDEFLCVNFVSYASSKSWENTRKIMRISIEAVRFHSFHRHVSKQIIFVFAYLTE